MKRLIVVGASGLIGAHLYDLARSQKDLVVIGTCHNRLRPGLLAFDMLRERLDEMVPDLGGGDVVCLLAAYSNPSWIFANAALAACLNVTASKALIDVVTAKGARLVFMSSVEVFDGNLGNYTEEAVPAPLNLYGRMKLEIEEYLVAKAGNHCIVRTGWNVGMATDHRCVVALTYETLLRPAARMARDNFFSLIDVRDTAMGLLRICADETIAICHLASAPPICRLDLATMVKKKSRFALGMEFAEVAFADIAYTEPRGRLNHLNCDQAIARYGLTFRQPKEIVNDKVAVLDEALQAARNGRGAGQ
ncbi:MAG: sugar nucleotide-binding protein [Desulfobulbaceae bacterium]|nr:sugar nucleotide-binding protein [Desulfobulbaceae bacterium]